MVQEEQHRGALANRIAHLAFGLHFDDVDTDIADRVIVAEPMLFDEDDFVLQPLGIGDAPDGVFVFPANARRGREGETRQRNPAVTSAASAPTSDAIRFAGSLGEARGATRTVATLRP